MRHVRAALPPVPLLVTLLLSLALLVHAPTASPAAARGDVLTVTNHGLGRPTRWACRQDPDEARCTITTRDGDAELVLTDDVVALQLTDRALAKARRQIRDTECEAGEYNPLAWFEHIVLSTVSAALECSAECPLDAVRDVRYDDGRLVLLDRHGRELFADIDVDSREVLEGFASGDAARFIAEFRRARGGLR